MKCEINRDFYCAIDGYREPFCHPNGELVSLVVCNAQKNCRFKHRKYPTPKQYKEEYGEEYPEERAVYFTRSNASDHELDISRYGRVKAGASGPMKEWDVGFIVCACTPFGPPLDDWRPE